MDLPIDQCANGVPTEIVAAIIQAESGGNLLAVNVNIRDGQTVPIVKPPTTVAEAASMAGDLISRGYSVDLGLMQVNSSNLERLGLSVEMAFDPCANIHAGATIFNEFLAGVVQYPQFDTPFKQVQAALSAYNTGSYWQGFVNGYVYRVVQFMGQPISAENASVAALGAPMEVSLSFQTDLRPSGPEISFEQPPLRGD